MLSTFVEIISQVPPSEWSIGVTGLSLFLLGGVIFAQDTTKRRGKFFLFLTAMVALWGMVLMLLDSVSDASSFHAVISSLFLIAGAVPLILFLFFYIFPAKGEPFSLRKALAIFSPYLIIVGAILASDIVIKYGEVHAGAPIVSFLGKGYLLYVGYVVVFLGLTFKVLFDKYRTSVGIFSAQSRSILIAFIAATGVSLASVFWFPRPISAYHVFLAGYIGIVASSVMLGFVLIKYNFWSFKALALEFFALLFVALFPASLLFTTSLLGIVINGIVALAVVFASFFLVASAKREVDSKDEIARLSSELTDMRARLKVLEKKKSEFLEVAAHHLRDPLTAIKGYSSMLLEGSFGELVPMLRGAVEKIFESSKRLVTMISDFMEISNIESGDIKYDLTEVDIKKIVLALVESMQAAARHSDVKLDVLVEDGEEGTYTIKADAGKMRQVILSLIDNAIKYTPRGNISVLLTRSQDKSKILFSIADTGIGMNEATMEKIFRKFSRASSANKTYTEGIGLGLFVAKEIIRRHEGRIWATSKGEGMGSTFYVELPRRV